MITISRQRFLLLCTQVLAGLLVSLLNACMVPELPTVDETIEVTTSAPSTTTPTKLPMATRAPLPSPTEAISTSTPNITSTLDARLTYQCLDIVASPLRDVVYDGLWLIESLGPANREDHYLDLATLQTRPFEVSFAFRAVVSPAGNRLAIIVEAEQQLIVLDNAGNILVRRTIEPDWDTVAAWLDNDRVLIERRRFYRDTEILGLPSLVVLNPFTGEKIELVQEDFPGLHDIYETVFEFRLRSRILPDHTLERVVYPGLEEGQTPLILWDLPGAREIVRIHEIGARFGHSPVWSPDGSQFVVNAAIRHSGNGFEPFDNLPGEPFVGGGELMTMSRDGQLRRLTYVTSVYSAAASSPAWSPDGRYVAYWLTVFSETPYPGERLAVVDTLTGQVTNYCIAGYPDFTSGRSGPPIWSPDGQFLAVTVPDPFVHDKLNGLLVDPARSVAVQFVESGVVRGWLASVP